jgi:hypothetical protein
VGLSPGELQKTIEDWVEHVYHQRPHRGIGMSPAEKADCDEYRPRRVPDEALRILFAVPNGKGGDLRVVGKKGVTFENGRYWGHWMLNRRGRKVIIRLDLTRAGRLYCFDPKSSEYLGEAIDLGLCEISAPQMMRARNEAKRLDRKRQKALETLGKDIDPVFMAIETGMRGGRAGNLTIDEKITDNPFVDAAYAASKYQPSVQTSISSVKAPEHSLTPNETEVLSLTDAQLETERPYFENALARFDWLREHKTEITEDDRHWLEECRSDWEWYALSFYHQWSPEDRIWLVSIAREIFGEFEIGGGCK